MDYSAEVTITPKASVSGTPRLTLVIAHPDGSDATRLPLLAVDDTGAMVCCIESVAITLAADGFGSTPPPYPTAAVEGAESEEPSTPSSSSGSSGTSPAKTASNAKAYRTPAGESPQAGKTKAPPPL